MDGTGVVIGTFVSLINTPGSPTGAITVYTNDTLKTFDLSTAQLIITLPLQNVLCSQPNCTGTLFAQAGQPYVTPQGLYKPFSAGQIVQPSLTTSTVNFYSVYYPSNGVCTNINIAGGDFATAFTLGIPRVSVQSITLPALLKPN